jgi:hypothetical protein
MHEPLAAREARNTRDLVRGATCGAPANRFGEGRGVSLHGAVIQRREEALHTCVAYRPAWCVRPRIKKPVKTLSFFHPRFCTPRKGGA